MSDCGDWCGATSRPCCVQWREDAAARVMVEARVQLARNWCGAFHTHGPHGHGCLGWGPARADAPPVLEHAPDHPYGTSVGPHGAWMRWCKVDGCDWVERSSDGATTGGAA